MDNDHPAYRFYPEPAGPSPALTAALDSATAQLQAMLEQPEGAASNPAQVIALHQALTAAARNCPEYLPPPPLNLNAPDWLLKKANQPVVHRPEGIIQAWQTLSQAEKPLSPSQLAQLEQNLTAARRELQAVYQEELARVREHNQLQNWIKEQCRQNAQLLPPPEAQPTTG